MQSAFTGGGSSQQAVASNQDHYELQNYTSIAAGRHSWKFGLRLRAVDIQDTSKQNFNGAYTFGGAYAPVLGADNVPVVAGIVCQANAPAAGRR